jgi:hypothetical protein
MKNILNILNILNIFILKSDNLIINYKLILIKSYNPVKFSKN